MRVYASFGDEPFVVTSDSDVCDVAAVLEEASKRFHIDKTELAVFRLDEEGRKVDGALSGSARVADKASVVVERVAKPVNDSVAAALKEQGNALLAAGKFKDALAKYSEALDLASISPGLAHVLRLNRSLANLKLSHWKAAAADASLVLASDAANVKARYRLGQALFGSGDLAAAHKVLSEALDLVRVVV